jgi:hypothetical protein
LFKNDPCIFYHIPSRFHSPLGVYLTGTRIRNNNFENERSTKMAELKKGVLNDEINEKDIEKETLASAEIDGVAGGTDPVGRPPYMPNPNGRPAVTFEEVKGNDGLAVSGAPDDRTEIHALHASESELHK